MPQLQVLNTQEDAAQFAMRNAHQLGIIMRITRQVIHCRSLQDIALTIKDAANQFNISGCFRATNTIERVSCLFGLGLNRGHCVGLSCFDSCDKKIVESDEYVTFNTRHVLMSEAIYLLVDELLTTNTRQIMSTKHNR